MSRILNLSLTVLFVCFGASLLVADEPGAKCPKACCAEQPTGWRCSQGRCVTGVPQVDVQLLIAEVDAETRVCLDAVDAPKTECSFREIVGSLIRPAPTSLRSKTTEFGITTDAKALSDLVHALKERGSAQILAAPRLTTLSGKSASMTVGSEFPIIIPLEDKNVVEFRECGVRIDCVPTVTDHETICIQLRPEISWPDLANGVVIKGCTIPGIVQRRSETTVEFRPGESFVLAETCQTMMKPDRALTCLATWWNLTNLSSNATNVLPPLCFANCCLLASAKSAISCPRESKEFVILVTADLCDVAREIERTIEVTAGIDEEDSDAPHRPAVLLTPTAPLADCDACVARPRAQLFLAPTSEQLFDAGLAGRIICNEPANCCRSCNQECCDESDKAEPRAGCCSKGRSFTCNEADDDDDDGDDDEDDDDDDDYRDGQIESFISQVLQAQMQYLDTMMRARLEHERQLLQTKAEAESALTKQQAAHAEEILKLRSDHIVEIQEMKEALWAAKFEALESQHQQALDHQREMFALQQKHTQELHSERIASLQTEIRSLRGHFNSGETDRVAHSPDTVHQSGEARTAIPIELPIQVEDLASGRVRYAPVPPKPDNVVLYQPRDVVERIEFSTPPISTNQTTMWQEMECLRREVTRLRALVEDMLCFAPDFPPDPVPQLPMGDMGDCEK